MCACRWRSGRWRPSASAYAQVLAWLEDGSGLVAATDFRLGYSPERFDRGNRTWTLATTPTIVSGIDDDSLAAVENFYRGIVDLTVAVSSPHEAELAKLIENTFRHVNIALMNELAMFGRDLGVNVWEARTSTATYSSLPSSTRRWPRSRLRPRSSPPTSWSCSPITMPSRIPTSATLRLTC